MPAGGRPAKVLNQNPRLRKDSFSAGAAVAFEWTPENIRTARQMWKAGVRAEDVASALGTTRNSVIGKMWRLRVPRPVGARASMPHTFADAYEAGRGACAVMSLSRGSCRWPLGEPRDPAFRFCAAPASAGSSYCSEHTRRATAPRVDAGRETAPLTA